MQRELNWRSVGLVALALVLTSCGTGSCNEWDNAPRTEYYIEGGNVEFRQTAEAQEDVLDYVVELMDGQRWFMDLWRVDADDSDERYKLRPGYVSSASNFHYQTDRRDTAGLLRMDGQLTVSGGELNFDIYSISQSDERFTELKAWGSCNYADAQRLIKQVRLPAWGDNRSSDYCEVSWELAGRFDGEPFAVSFSQVYYGRSRYPVYPYRLY